MNNQADQMKWALFWVFLILFVLMVLGTLAMVFFGFGSPTESERELMVKGLIGEVAACIIALFYSIFGLKSRSASDSEITDLKGKVSELSTQLESLGFKSSTKNIRSNSCEIEQGKTLKNDAGSLAHDRLSSFDKAIEDFTVEPPFSHDVYNVKPLPIDIKEDILSAKPFDLHHREESYIGMKVQWIVLFSTISEEDENNYHITADADSSVLLVSFNIEKSDGQSFKHLDKDTPFWVSGEISSAESLVIKLKDIFIKFEN